MFKLVLTNLNKLQTLHLQKSALVAVMQAQIDSIQAQIDLETQGINSQIKKLEVKIKEQALVAGPGTIKGDAFQAVVYNTSTWNGELLKEMATEAPFIMEAFQQKIVVQIKKVGGAK